MYVDGQYDVVISGLHSGKRLQKTMEKSTIFNGNTHYFNGHFQ